MDKNTSRRGTHYQEVTKIPDIRERDGRKEIKAKGAKGKAPHRAGKTAKRQLTAKGREALQQRPQGESGEIEGADDVVEQAAVDSISETVGTARRGVKKGLSATQGKRRDIKERKEPGPPLEASPSDFEPSYPKERRAEVKERPGWAGPSTKTDTPGLEHPHRRGRGIKEKQTESPRQYTVPKQTAKGTAPARPGYSQPLGPSAQSASSSPSVYQEKMRRAAVQSHRENVIRSKGESVPEISPALEELPLRFSDTVSAPWAGGRSTLRERRKAPTLKEKTADRPATSKARHMVGRATDKVPAVPIKAVPPGKAVQKAAADQAKKRMEHYGQQKLIRQAKQTAQVTTQVSHKAAVIVGKAIAAMVNAVTGLVSGGILLVALCVIILISAVVASPFGLFFSGEQPGPGTILPREAVAQLNAEYAARIEALKSGSYDGIEMSGQPADWRDILAVFAVKTAGADDGVDVATLDCDRIARLRAVYWDMTTITSWVETIDHDDSDPDDDVDDSWTEYILHVTVTSQTADEAADSYGFSPDQRTLLAELQAPENNDLWLALLYGVSATDSQIVAVALSQLGNVGGDPYWSWYGYAYHVDWCACFVSWCANECGYLDSGIIPRFSSCSLGSQWFQSRGQWADKSIEPVPGMFIFFDWDGNDGQDGNPDHVGIVERIENGRVYTIEGNSGDQCRENSYPIGYYEIYGYGIPNY